MKHVLLPIVLCFLVTQIHAQVLNTEVNFEMRIAEFYGNSDNDATSTDEQNMLITAYVTDLTSGTQVVGPLCTYFDCHAPCTMPEDFAGNPRLAIWGNGLAFDVSFDLDLNAWGDESDLDCEFVAGEDQDQFMGLASDYNLVNAMITSNRTPVEWYTNFGSNDNWVFPNDILYNLKPKAIWRYTAGDGCSSPLNFGTLVSGETKAHTNTNRSAPEDIFGPNPLGYTHQGGITAGPDVYYTFTLMEASMVTISTANDVTDYDTYLSLYPADCSTLLAENDDVSDFDLRSNIDITLDPGQYTVIVEGFGLEEGNFELIVTSEAVVNATELDPSLPISVSPNPTDGLLYLNLPETMNLRSATAEVINLHGQLLQRISLASTASTIDLTAYPAGTYLLRIITEEGQISKKIMVF